MLIEGVNGDGGVLEFLSVHYDGLERKGINWGIKFPLS
jgi:hypothetical protein